MVAMLMIAMMAQVSGGEPPVESPEAVMRAFFDDLGAERWRAAAERFHPEMVASLRAGLLEQARAEAERPPMDSADLYPPDMPQEVRDYFERRRAQSWQQHDPGLPPWMILDTVEALDGMELLARVLEWSDPRTELRRTMRAQDAPASMEGYADVMSQRYRVLGSVVEGASAYVVFEAEPRFTPGLPLSGISTAELRRHEDGWRIWSHPGYLGGGWMGHATLAFGFGTEGVIIAPPPDSVFEWGAEGQAALRVLREGDSIRLHLRSREGTSTSILLPPEALERLLEYLAVQHFTRPR